jgi:hypothetical protein
MFLNTKGIRLHSKQNILSLARHGKEEGIRMLLVSNAGLVVVRSPRRFRRSRPCHRSPRCRGSASCWTASAPCTGHSSRLPQVWPGLARPGPARLIACSFSILGADEPALKCHLLRCIFSYWNGSTSLPRLDLSPRPVVNNENMARVSASFSCRRDGIAFLFAIPFV